MKGYYPLKNTINGKDTVLALCGKRHQNMQSVFDLPL